MPSKTVKKNTFKEVLVNKVDEYIDRAFATENADERQKYREVIRQMEKLIITVSDIE